MSKKLYFILLILVASAVVLGAGARYLISENYLQAALLRDLFNKLLPPTPALPEGPSKPSVPPAPLYESSDSYEEAVINAVERASPAVVSITISKNVPVLENCPVNPFGDMFGGLPPEFQQFFGAPFQFRGQCKKGVKRQEVGGGSGFIISSDGMILTNKHVVSDEAAEYTVLTNDGKKYDAKVLARDPIYDIAIMKVEASGLPVLRLGDSDRVRLGQTAIAIGNALGEFRNTVSKGIISGLARNLTAGDGQGGAESIEGVIQTDAAINPGNSGGPLLNLRGEVIGVNTAIVSGAQNIGFAIPINQAKRDIDSVKATGKITVPYLGVRFLMINEEIAKRDNLLSTSGALLRGTQEGPAVVKDSPAAKAGLQAEDIVTEINGVKVDEDHSLLALIQRYKAGDTVTLKVLRDGKNIEVKVKLEERK